MTLLDDSLFSNLLIKAGESPRRRINYNFHTGPEDNPHRFLNVFLKGSYVAPHRHKFPPKAESFIVLEGWMVIFTFNDAGQVEQVFVLGSGTPPESYVGPTARGIDLQPGVWHTVAAVTDTAICYEVKPGPWDPATDKEFAPWAPWEGDPEAPEYLRSLLAGANLLAISSD